MNVYESGLRLAYIDWHGLLYICFYFLQILTLSHYRVSSQQVSGNPKLQITCVVACSADGKIVPPLYLVPHARYTNQLRARVPENFHLNSTDRGWMNGEVNTA
jgi:hypothetical protein